MRLESWMEAAGHDDRSLAAEIVKHLPSGEGCSASGVRKWRFGERVPRPSRMKILNRITGGKVTPNDFADLPERSLAVAEQAARKSGKAA